MQNTLTETEASSQAIVPDATATMEVVELSGFDWLLTGISLLILFAFVTSITKWVSLLRRRVKFFGEGALLPERPRARPYWNPLYFLFFFAVLIVANLQFNQLAAEYAPAEVVVSTDEAVEADAAPTISVLQLLLSSASMVTATIVTMWLARTFRPRVRVDATEGHERPKIGWLPAQGDFWLGFKSAWLILPPTMMLMGLVSVLQKYSHPVLEALKPDGPGASPDFGIFAALFFTTAIVTPIVEEFWFRGMLQGGLQRIADAANDVRKWTVATPVDGVPAMAPPEILPESAMPGEMSSSANLNAAVGGLSGKPGAAHEAGLDNPYASPQLAPETLPVQPADIASDFATRSDWTPTAIWPIVVASILFAVMHWGQGLAPIPLFFLSMGLGYLYRQTGSLVPSIVVHFVLNGFTMSATLLELLR
ncbi:membrane protease YdiL (CAAX protease family) [Rhodopirellula rubra]|uniref:Membrane protease YdiL (CAAX protease family) n=1 Tax=Aporhodopirellula rubra TaxID=980271 RepID=A0A7W5E4S5_9BACT|nr:type II CAAX endopeptidase family protein [Aporhodopirellula rubra]MBB3210196.1 membrane protease YdiL (CAAX protease family) [Aporhodopirellula rubra]